MSYKTKTYVNIKDFCIDKQTSIKSVMKIIDTSGYGIAFITQNKKLLGVVTDSDIRRALLKGVTLDTSVEQVMNKEPITLTESDIKDKNYKIAQFPIYGLLQVPVVNKYKEIIDVILITKKEIVGRLLDGKKEHRKVKRILVVGGAGYLGSVLCKQLLSNGYQVRVFDNLLYGDIGIKNIYPHKNFEFYHGDIRDFKAIIKAIKDVDAVIHLAAIVGDPASNLNPEVTIQSNYLATKLLAEICKYSQINRFLFSSTCSLYGASKSGKLLTEESTLNPVSLYAQMKLKSEQGILELEDENFAPTILRMATLYGVSPRMRFDLVVNTLTIKALKDKQFKIFGGNQWRALCSVNDAASAYVKCLEAPIDKVKGQIFNVTTDNKQIKDIGNLVKSFVPDSKKIVEQDKTDIRNYCVSSDKIKKSLNFKQNDTIVDEIIRIKLGYTNGGFYIDYPHKKYSNYEFLKGEHDY